MHHIKKKQSIYKLFIKREIASNMIKHLSGLENIPNDISNGYLKKKSLYKKRK